MAAVWQLSSLELNVWCWVVLVNIVSGFTLVLKIISTNLRTLDGNQPNNQILNIDFYWNLWYRLHLYQTLPLRLRYKSRDVRKNLIKKIIDPRNIINLTYQQLIIWKIQYFIIIFYIFTFWMKGNINTDSKKGRVGGSW